MTPELKAIRDSAIAQLSNVTAILLSGEELSPDSIELVKFALDRYRMERSRNHVAID